MRAYDLRIGVVILAAGASTRLGRPKQLLTIDGETLLRRTVTTALSFGGDPVVVVLGANADQLRPEIDGLPVTTVTNTDWEEGMASSLRAGISALSLATAAIVTLCDQPMLSAETLQALADRYIAERPSAVVSRYENGAQGPPCLFNASLFPDLLALAGSQGAKHLLARLPAASVREVSFPGGALDIDTPEDWQRFVERKDRPDP